MNPNATQEHQSKQQKTLRLIIIITAVFAFLVILYLFENFIASFFTTQLPQSYNPQSP